MWYMLIVFSFWPKNHQLSSWAGDFHDSYKVANPVSELVLLPESIAQYVAKPIYNNYKELPF